MLISFHLFDFTLASLLLKAVTEQPIAFENFIARCPSPPIPKTPTVQPGFAYFLNGEYTVIPAHINGPTAFKSSPSGILKHSRLSQR